MILHDFSLYTSLHLPGETRVTSVTYSTLIDFMLHVVTQNALFSPLYQKDTSKAASLVLLASSTPLDSDPSYPTSTPNDKEPRTSGRNPAPPEALAISNNMIHSGKLSNTTPPWGALTRILQRGRQQ